MPTRRPQDLPLSSTPQLTTTELLVLIRELLNQDAFANAAAAAKVKQNTAASVRPQLVYRCSAGGCHLFSAWQHPNTILISHRSIRIGASRLASKQSVPGNVLHTPGTTMPDISGPAIEGALSIPARAYSWQPGKTIFVLCDHFYGSLGEKFGPVLIDEIAAALRVRGTRVLGVSPQDKDGHKLYHQHQSPSL